MISDNFSEQWVDSYKSVSGGEFCSGNLNIRQEVVKGSVSIICAAERLGKIFLARYWSSSVEILTILGDFDVLRT